MILDELVLHNFRVYRGRQRLNLRPKAGKPIILIGGQNGEGKTTLLDALQLVLFGSQAQLSSGGNGSYEKTLRSSIHKHVASQEGAGIELAFRHFEDGAEHEYRVRRTWVGNGKRVKERLEVLRDGAFDRVLSGAWPQQVHSFLPARIAPLFLFDGEKIEGLADPASAAALLRTALRGLLGLEVVERLKTDLGVLRRRNSVALRSEADQSKIAFLEEEVAAAKKDVDDVVTEQRRQRTVLDGLEKELRAVEEELVQRGIGFLKNRDALEEKRKQLLTDTALIEDQLCSLVAGVFPLTLVQAKLQWLRKQAGAEARSRDATVLLEYLEERDVRVIRLLNERQVPRAVQDQVSNMLAEDREQVTLDHAVPVQLGLDAEDERLIGQVVDSAAAECLEAVQRLLADLESAKGTLIDVERSLAAVPDDATLGAKMEVRDQLREKIAAGRGRLQALDDELGRAHEALKRRKSARDREVHQEIDHKFELEDRARIVRHADRARATLARFATRVVEHHLARIETLVSEGYNKLLRKQTLVRSVKIDPESFAVHLIDTDGNELATEQLSAGERQLLAVSLLWALGRRSGRPLPAVIDTPLGRLDSSHRENLVRQYFPYASHQVVLLSTDEEIDPKHQQALSRWTTRTYRLEHEDSAGATTVREGYFWESP